MFALVNILGKGYSFSEIRLSPCEEVGSSGVVFIPLGVYGKFNSFIINPVQGYLLGEKDIMLSSYREPVILRNYKIVRKR